MLIGFGASSIGRLPQGYVQNEVRIAEYQRLIAESRLPVARGYRFKGDDLLRGEIIERLMCDHHVDLAAVCHRYGGDLASLLERVPLELLIRDGLIAKHGNDILVKPFARPLVRSIAAVFDAYLEPTGAYSRAL